MTGIRAPAPSPAPKTVPPPESKWMLERGGVSIEAGGLRGEAEVKQPRGACASEISEALHGDPFADGITLPRFQLSSEQHGDLTCTPENDHILHRKANTAGPPLLAAKQVETHVGNKVTRHDILEGEISKETYVGVPVTKQIKIERSVSIEINNKEQEGYVEYRFDFSMDNSGGLICQSTWLK